MFVLCTMNRIITEIEKKNASLKRRKCLHRHAVFKPNCGSLKDESIENYLTKSDAQTRSTD